MLSDASVIVIDGAGLLEYSSNSYQEQLLMISNYAEEKGIPLVFNSIGRAGEFDKTDYRCRVLMKAFQNKCVKYVSARDSRESVQECVGERFNVKLLADAAFYSSEAFGITKNVRNRTVGIGIIRGDALLSYGVNYSEDDWIRLFISIANELENRGYKYEFFTNGALNDYLIGEKIIRRMGISKKKLVNRPTKAKELLRTISSYEGIIICRMHSSIAAFSMQIPSIILSWNKKVEMYMDIVGYPERAIRFEEFNALNIVDKFEHALAEGIDSQKHINMKDKARESVRDYSWLFN